jgi:hypothetical protein
MKFTSSPPRARLGIFRLKEALHGECGVCGLIGHHEFFDVDLLLLVGCECRDELRDAEIQCRAFIEPFV